MVGLIAFAWFCGWFYICTLITKDVGENKGMPMSDGMQYALLIGGWVIGIWAIFELSL